MSLYGHAPEVQVARWGLPLITHLFITDPAMQEEYNRAGPAADLERFGTQIAEVANRITEIAGSAADPSAYAQRLVDRLCPGVLPYQVGTDAGFDYAGFNGRALADDVMDVMLTLMADTALADGVAPNRDRISTEFPYFGRAHRIGEQAASTS